MTKDIEFTAQNIQYNWRKRRVDSDRDTAPESLWHYTDGAGLMGILESEKLWATSTRFLNDVNEIEYGLGIAKDATEEILAGQQWQPHTVSLLKKMMGAKGMNLPGFLSARSEIYVACFCEERDLLSQWRAYGGPNTFGGYALKFQPKAGPHVWVEHLGSTDIRLEKVIYDREVQIELIKELLTPLTKLYDDTPSEEQMASVVESFREGLLEFSTFCKHPSFQEEKEWRIVYSRGNSSEHPAIEYRNSHGLIVPFVSLRLPDSQVENNDLQQNIEFLPMPITEVLVGPSPDPDLKKIGLWQFLRSSSTFQNVEITGTDSPLRV